MLFMSCVCLFIAAWVTCWERADLLALVCEVKLCFCHFPMWYYIVSISDLCHFSYFHIEEKMHSMGLSKTQYRALIIPSYARQSNKKGHKIVSESDTTFRLKIKVSGYQPL